MLKKFLSLLLLFCAPLSAKPIAIVAAENVYGNIAQQIGGEQVTVTSILNNPNQDPHLFSSNPHTAEILADADLVIYNGIDYDPWMQTLLAASQHQPQQMNVAQLAGKHSGDNPHIWYDPAVILLYANALTDKLSQMDPEHKDQFQQQLNTFKQQHSDLSQYINQLKSHWQGIAVIATEPVFNEMAKILGLTMLGNHFQLSVMNDTEPSVQDIQDFENKLTTRQVKALIYNSQVTSPLTERMQEIAKGAGIPIVGVSETEPQDQPNYFQWLRNELKTLATALNPK